MEAWRALEQKDERFSLVHWRMRDPISEMARDVRSGLSAARKSLPPKYFYDRRGSLLFERICETPEYYPTRTEEGLLAEIADDAIARVRPGAIVELGSGSSRKTVRLLDACEHGRRHCAYVPIDICDDMLVRAGSRLLDRYSWLQVHACAGDYTAGLEALPPVRGPRLCVFLGGTIGNFDSLQCVQFLRGVRAWLRGEDRLLLGADRVKPTAVLNAAYNDAQGHTAAFNLNVLRVINRELGGEFALDDFEHSAFYNEEAAQVEMHLRARREHEVAIRAIGQRFRFTEGESILTEISRKFTPESLAATLHAGGFALDTHYQAPDGAFSLVLARPL